MVVVYYTSTYYLDVIIETIQSIKNDVELHVVIEITPESRKSTIISVEDLNQFKDIENCEQVLGVEKWAQLKHYFEGVASVQFAVFKHKRGLSFTSLKKAFALGRFLKRLHVDIVHFDSITTRAIGLYPFLRSKKVFISIHDSVPHSGEFSWKEKIPNFVFFRLAKGFFFYSGFACEQFKQYYKSITVTKYNIWLQPYSYVSQFLGHKRSNDQAILFFGRLSLYKGIDLLLEAIPTVLAKYPNEKFIIAGSPAYGYEMDRTIVDRYPENIRLISRYLTTDELVEFIENSKFIICPYRDATQSGVLMTTFAAGKTVIATNVGSFSEYIHDDVNGLLAEPTVDAIANKILQALEADRYKRLEENVISSYSEETGEINRKCILDAYQNG